jgi:hypothetical protein
VSIAADGQVISTQSLGDVGNLSLGCLSTKRAEVIRDSRLRRGSWVKSVQQMQPVTSRICSRRACGGESTQLETSIWVHIRELPNDGGFQLPKMLAGSCHNAASHVSQATDRYYVRRSTRLYEWTDWFMVASLGRIGQVAGHG